MKVTIVARDLAPSRALEMVRQKLLENGVEIAGYLGSDKLHGSSPEQIRNDIRNSKLLFLGMSSSAELAKEELFAAREALFAGVPYGFYADLYGCVNRGWFEPFRRDARFIFVISEREAEAARFLYPKAEVVISGNPVLEDAFFPSKSPKEVRQALNVYWNGTFVLCPGGKDLATNRIHFQSVIGAFSRIYYWNHWKVFFMLHRNDKNDPAVYEDIIEASQVSARVLTPKNLDDFGFTSLDIISACDLMIAAGSTAEIEAACQRKPVITFLFPEQKKRLLEQTGSNRWYPCELGTSRLVEDDPAKLAPAIMDLCDSEVLQEIRKRQEECFPVPKERGIIVKIMTDTLMKLAPI